MKINLYTLLQMMIIKIKELILKSFETEYEREKGDAMRATKKGSDGRLH